MLHNYNPNGDFKTSGLSGMVVFVLSGLLSLFLAVIAFDWISRTFFPNKATEQQKARMARERSELLAQSEGEEQ